MGGEQVGRLTEATDSHISKSHKQIILGPTIYYVFLTFWVPVHFSLIPSHFIIIWVSTGFEHCNLLCIHLDLLVYIAWDIVCLEVKVLKSYFYFRSKLTEIRCLVPRDLWRLVPPVTHSMWTNSEPVADRASIHP